jgi:SpoVK/Ycf46/Vps4 family AAA+-type ATPase
MGNSITKKKRDYKITTIEQAKVVSRNFLKSIELDRVLIFGLPEIDDRYHIWRVPVKSKNNEKIGEIVIDAITH